MKYSKTIFFIVLTLIGLTVILYLDFHDKEFKIHDILVESHGLIFDLLVFGLLLTIYDSIKSKQDKITRYREEIKDYSFWESDEAKYRVRGLVGRLVKLKAKKVDLSNCYVKSCPWTKKMNDWKFINASLFKSIFINCDLSNSNFYLAKLYESSFSKVNLTDCNFGMVILDKCDFNDCVLNSTSFDFAYVTEKDWLENLMQNENIGSEFLKEKYIISTNTISMNSKEYYQIIEKAHNTTEAVEREKKIHDNILNFRPRFNFNK